MSLIPSGLAKSGVSAFYTKEVGGSLSFDRSTPAYLYRTFGTPSTDGAKCFTISVWVKRAGNTGNNNYIMDSDTTNEHVLAFEGDLLRFGAWSGGDQFNIKTNARKLRDTQGWYHIVCAVDTRKATDTDRVIFYINGERLPSTELQGTYPSQNFTGRMNVSGNAHQIGRWGAGTGREFDGYMAEFHFIDAQQQTADDFGEFKSGVWIPKEYSGTYGNNGFYLDMVSSNFSSPTLSDSSGNSNNWTVSGIGSNDFVLDSCTNNYAVMNYWWPYNSANQNVTYSEGNRKYAMGSSNSRGAATMEVLADGCYFEMLCKSNTCAIGVQSIDGQTRYVWNAVNNGELSNISGTDPAGFSDGDIVAVAVGTDGNIKLYKNGTLQGSDNTLTGYTAGDPLLPLLGEFATAGSNTIIANFGQDSTFAGNKTRQGNTDENGQGDFYYTPPTGFVALCTANMPTPAADPASDVEPRDYFESFIWEGNGGGQQVGDVIKKPADTTTISNSLIFNDDDSAYLSKSMSTVTGAWTLSMWIKRTGIGKSYDPLGSFRADEYRFENDVLKIESGFTSSMSFKDSSTWYHLVFSDSGSNQTVYVNGISIGTTGFSRDFGDSGTVLGRMAYNSTYFDGYMAEVHFVDGTAYNADTFGNFDANGIWIPKAVTGITYGTNGFYLDFADSAALGDDESGNTNDWTANNFATTDQVVDSPTNNFMTMSPTDQQQTGGSVTLSEGNLRVNHNTDGHWNRVNGASKFGNGKWYYEFQIKTVPTGTSTNWAVGFREAGHSLYSSMNDGFEDSGDYIYWVDANTAKIVADQDRSAGTTSGITAAVADDYINIAIEKTDGNIKAWFGINGTWFNSGNPATGANPAVDNDSDAQGLVPAVAFYAYPGSTNGNGIFNFGQKTFNNTIPTGFSRISEDNITVNDQNLESPDLVWVKNRDNADNHYIYDEVRGVAKAWASDDFYAEIATPNGLVDFNTNGFTVGNDGGLNRANQSYVAWTWKANGSGVDSTSDMGGAGTGASSTTSANSDLGIGITKYYIGSSPDTYKAIPHGLGATPEFIIVKNLDSGQWPVVHHHKLGTNGYLNLGLNTNAAQSDISYFRTGLFDSTNFYVGGANETGAASTNFISYCFVGKEGFSKFGIYDDSYYSDYNADGPFIYCGFRPAWIFIKSTSGGRPFVIYDNKRSPVNPAILWLQPDTTHGDQSDGTNHDIDFMANGFKVKGGSGDVNTTGENYIFAAFAEMPFKYATAR